jgi:hypothetical protein
LRSYEAIAGNLFEAFEEIGDGASWELHDRNRGLSRVLRVRERAKLERTGGRRGAGLKRSDFEGESRCDRRTGDRD